MRIDANGRVTVEPSIKIVASHSHCPADPDGAQPAGRNLVVDRRPPEVG
jgi:hypothetical protein